MKYILVAISAAYVRAYDILKDCGAVPSLNNEASLKDTQQNSKALNDCFMKAQADPNDRTVVVRAQRPHLHLYAS